MTMKGILRRWLRLDEKRGTLTFLPDGSVILGLPENASVAMADGVRRQMSAWLDGNRGSALVFPFPVDVMDLRP
jgi:hypothetical protein